MAEPTHLQPYGDLVKVLMDDGTSRLAVPTGGSLMLITASGGGGPVDPTGFKFPFPRSDINFTSYPGHSGIDRPGGGYPVRSIGPGVVLNTTSFSGNTYPGDSSEPVWRGNSITINHGDIGGINISSLYAHMAAPSSLAIGAVVTTGQVFGTSGNTGFSDGAHIHLEVIYNNIRLTSSSSPTHVPGLGFTRTINWLDANAEPF